MKQSAGITVGREFTNTLYHPAPKNSLFIYIPIVFTLPSYVNMEIVFTGQERAVYSFIVS